MKNNLNTTLQNFFTKKGSIVTHFRLRSYKDFLFYGDLLIANRETKELTDVFLDADCPQVVKVICKKIMTKKYCDKVVNYKDLKNNLKII